MKKTANSETRTRMGVTILGIVAMAMFGVAACSGGGDSASGDSCDRDEDCASGTCNQQTHQCESDVEQDSGVPVDSGMEPDASAGDQQDADTPLDGGTEPDARPPECAGDSDCTDPDRPVCDDGACRGCADDNECTARWPDRPHCSEGRCIGVCGNGHIDGSEECDTQDFGGKSCASETGLSEGALTCTADCRIETSGCHECGNGTVEAGEECDGSDLGGKSCGSETGLSQGALSCTADCRIETSGCHECGNGTIEGPEVCDGANLAGQSCATFGYDLGDLSCAGDCMTLDQSACTNCGNGTCDDDETTESCPDDCGWVDVTAGADFACGIKADGSLWCWGYNGGGQVGVSSTRTLIFVPTRVSGLSQVRKVSLGAGHACAVDNGSNVYCWGDNRKLQVHYDPPPRTVSQYDSPYDENMVSADAGLVAGELHTCVGTLSGLSRTLSVSCWGANNHGQLGNGTTSLDPVPTPQSVPGAFTAMFSSVSYTQCGTLHYYSTSQGRFVDEVRCWGDNEEGTANPDSMANDVTTPEVVQGVEGIMGGSGSHFSCALNRNGTAHCWGSDARMVRGVSSAGRAPNVVPIAVALSGLTVGMDHSCAWTDAGVLYCWGYNDRGGSDPSSNLDMVLPSAVVMPGGERVSKAAAGRRFSCALTDSHKIYCWGANQFGQCGAGDGLGFSIRTPIEVVDPYGD